ncbi:transmembrane protein 145-like [Pelomyxa schiedti]|nr:transmembrane protein 145-like [Pelomyxa schiedti]
MNVHWRAGLELLVVICGLCVGGVYSLVTIHHKVFDENWAFVEKFCFLNKGAYANVDFYSISAGTAINFYADMEYSWPKVYNTRDQTSCAYKIHSASRSYTQDDMPFQVHIYGGRDRWWFVAASNCDGDEIDIHYNFTFINPSVSGDQFSADEIGLLQEVLLFLSLFWALAIGLAISLVILIKNKLQYAITDRLLAVVAVEAVALIFWSVHVCIFSNNGIGYPELVSTFNFFDIVSELIFLLLILYLGKGYKISSRKLTHHRLLLLLWFPFIWAYLALYFYQLYGVDPATTLYIYESIPGYIIIALRILMMFVFLFIVSRTFIIETRVENRRFYIVFAATYALWFISLPIIVLAMHFVPAWRRQKVVVPVQLGVKFFSYLILALMFRPLKSNKFVQKMDPQISFDNALQVFPATAPAAERKEEVNL